MGLSDLERIEARVKATTLMEDPCADIYLGDDLVKLARALDGVLRWMPPWDANYPSHGKAFREAEQALHEVAGGDDDRT